MPRRVQKFRLNDTEMSAFVGLLAELIVNTTKKTVHVHDGETPGGIALAREDLSTSPSATTGNPGVMSAAQAGQLGQLDTDVQTIATGLTAEITSRLAASMGKESYAETAGTGTNYTVTMTPTRTALVDGEAFRFKFHASNTGPCDIDVDSLGAITLRDFRGRQLPPGELTANRVHEFYYDATAAQFRQRDYPEAREGTIVARFSAVAEPGWLACNGTTFDAALYVRLNDHLGGNTLPDFRGRVLAGHDSMGATAASRLTGTSGGVNGATLGAAGGSQQHTLTTGQMPEHDHGMTTGDDISTAAGQGNVSLAREGADDGNVRQFTAEGSNQPHNNVQPTIIVYWFIKA